jgi:membrane-associated protease RseP (regulator of RpoE activity)
VTSFNAAAMSNWTQVSNAILKAKPGTPVTLTVLRDGHAVTLHTELARVPGHGSYLGVSSGIVFQRQSPLAALGYVGTGFSQVLSGSVHALAQLPAAVPHLFSQNRSSTAAGNVTSVVGAARETGQAVAANVGWKYKVSFVLLLIASLNIFVGVLNLLPLLPMDGGHVAVVIWERVKALFARLVGRPDPGLVDYRKLVPLSFSIFLVLVVFGMMLILADIVNPVNIQ